MSIIKVENLSKKYIIGHDRGAQGAFQYYSLRDSLAHFGRGMYQRLRHPLSPNQEITELEEFWALKDINFEIKQGDRVGIIGRNGAGKSTLLKILSRITEPTSGKITMRGRVASLLEVGTGFHPELTGRENIYLNGAILGMTRVEIKKKFDEIVAFAEVEKFLDTPVKRYSSGMYVRLAFAVAAHLEPEILLVDEVLAVGDAEFQKKCLGKMEDVSKEGRTVIFVSHNMGAIQQLCHKGILLDKGMLISYNNISKTIKQYQQQSKKEKFVSLEDIRVECYRNTKIKFSEIALFNSKTKTSFGQEIEFDITIDSQKNIKGLSIAASFFDLNNTCIATLFCKKEFTMSAGQRLKLNLHIPFFCLVPGSYYVGFSIGSGNARSNRYDYDIVIGYPIEVDSNENDTAMEWQSSWGYLCLNNCSLTQKDI